MSGKFIRFAIILFVYIFYSFNVIASNPSKIDESVSDFETNRLVPYTTLEHLMSNDSKLVKSTIVL